MTYRIETPKANLEFSTTLSFQKSSRAFATTIDNRKWQCRLFGAIFVISGCPSLSQSLGDTFVELVMVENAAFTVGILTLSVMGPEI